MAITLNKIRLTVKDSAGVVMVQHTFDLREDEPKLDYEWIKEDYTDPIIMENGKLETYEWGVRLRGSLTFYMENPSLNILNWQAIIYTILNGGKMYLALKGNRYYEVYLTSESRRSYMDGFWASVIGKLDFIGKDLYKEIPKEF